MTRAFPNLTCSLVVPTVSSSQMYLMNPPFPHRPNGGPSGTLPALSIALYVVSPNEVCQGHELSDLAAGGVVLWDTLKRRILKSTPCYPIVCGTKKQQVLRELWDMASPLDPSMSILD